MTSVPYGGVTFDALLDLDRLNAQSRLVARLMVDGCWRSLAEIAAATGAPEASVSARLRDLRKPANGGHTVERRRRGGAGTHEYRLVLAGR